MAYVAAFRTLSVEVYTPAPVPWASALTSPPTVITPQGFGLRWIGSAANYQVQRATNLIAPSNTVWENITATRAAGAVNFHVDTHAGPQRAFYRILDVP